MNLYKFVNLVSRVSIYFLLHICEFYDLNCVNSTLFIQIFKSTPFTPFSRCAQHYNFQQESILFMLLLNANLYSTGHSLFLHFFELTKLQAILLELLCIILMACLLIVPLRMGDVTSIILCNQMLLNRHHPI